MTLRGTSRGEWEEKNYLNVNVNSWHWRKSAHLEQRKRALYYGSYNILYVREVEIRMKIKVCFKKKHLISDRITFIGMS